MTKRRAEITIETERILVIEQTTCRLRIGWCAACGAETQLIALDEAAAALRISTPAMRRWAEAARLHFNLTTNGALSICLDPLATETVVDAKLLS